MRHEDKLAVLQALDNCSFAELAATLHALKFTGQITLHFLNGAPQMAELGEPVQVRFPEHPANHMAGGSGSGGRRGVHNSIDTSAVSPPSSSP